MWFEPQRVGTYELYCAEYCGLEHSYMYSYVKVMEDSAFQAWVADTTLVPEDVESPYSNRQADHAKHRLLCMPFVGWCKTGGTNLSGLWGSERQ
jgi:cytochrome c oxidase subunit II